MQCRNCGTEIADKAIVCYRCGTATTDPVRKPVPVRGTGPRPSLVTAIVPLLVALALIVLADTSGYPKAMDAAAGALAVLGAGLLVARAARRH